MHAEIRDLRQFKEWAEPQIITHGADVLTIAQLRVKVAGLEGQVQGYKDAIASHRCPSGHLNADDLWDLTHPHTT